MINDCSEEKLVSKLSLWSIYDQWLVDSEPIFDPPWVIDKPSRYCHGQVRTSGTCTSGPGWATGGLLVGVCWVGYRWFKFGNGSKPMVFIFVYIYYVYIYIPNGNRIKEPGWKCSKPNTLRSSNMACWKNTFSAGISHYHVRLPEGMP